MRLILLTKHGLGKLKMTSVSGKVVIITGASRGIGEAIAKHFAELGSKVSLAGRDTEKLEQVAAFCREHGTSTTEVITIVGDIRNKEDRETLIQRTIDHFGKLDVLINNAGIASFYQVSSATPEQFQEVFDTNVTARMCLTQLAIPHLKKSKGNIINLSSTLSRHATPIIGVYCMSHAAMDMFTECLALELAEYGVRVNSINPGYIDTEIVRKPGMMFQDDQSYREFLEFQNTLHPMGRYGQPRDCTGAAAFLASDAASYVTGNILYVDGGRHCLPPGVKVGQSKDDA